MATVISKKVISSKKLQNFILEITSINKDTRVAFLLDSIQYSLSVNQGVNATKIEIKACLSELIRKGIIILESNCDCGAEYYKYV